MPHKPPSNLCFLCLSTDRKIFALPERHRRLFSFITNGFLQSRAQVCWECSGSLQRFYSFKQQAERAVRALEYLRIGSQTVSLPCLSRLSGTQMVVIDLLVSQDGYIAKRTHKIDEPTSQVWRKDAEQKAENLGDVIHVDPISDIIYIKDTSDVEVKVEYERNDDNKLGDDESKRIGVTVNNIGCSIESTVDNESSVCCSSLDGQTKTEGFKSEFKTESVDLDECDGESSEEERAGSAPRRLAVPTEQEVVRRGKRKKCASKRALCGANCRRRKSTAGNKYKRWYKCHACDCSYESEEAWRKHDAEVHPTGAEPACLCYRKKTERQVKRCVKVDLPARNPETGTLDCVICGSKLKCNQGYRRHYLIHISNERYECDICNKVFKTRLQIQMHLRQHYPFKVLCNICGKGLRSQQALSVHMYAHSGIESRPYKCDICPRKFIGADKLRIHALHHTGVRDFACHLCPSAYYVKFELTRHLRKAHGISDPESTYKKKYVNRTPSMARNKNFGRSPNTRISNKSSKESNESKEQNLLCNICGKRFASYMCLWAHKVVHTGARPYKCPKCDQRFKFQSNVLTHVRSMHTAEKVHECATCGARFKLKGNLTAHMKLHTGEKPYACDICNQKFLRNRNLRNHYKVHGQAD